MIPDLDRSAVFFEPNTILNAQITMFLHDYRYVVRMAHHSMMDITLKLS